MSDLMEAGVLVLIALVLIALFLRLTIDEAVAENAQLRREVIDLRDELEAQKVLHDDCEERYCQHG